MHHLSTHAQEIARAAGRGKRLSCLLEEALGKAAPGHRAHLEKDLARVRRLEAERRLKAPLERPVRTAVVALIYARIVTEHSPDHTPGSLDLEELVQVSDGSHKWMTEPSMPDLAINGRPGNPHNANQEWLAKNDFLLISLLEGLLHADEVAQLDGAAALEFARGWYHGKTSYLPPLFEAEPAHYRQGWEAAARAVDGQQQGDAA